MKKGGRKKHSDQESVDEARPELARRRANRNSTMRSGRTIGEAREHLETANERAAARKKDKKKATRRVVFTVFGFLILIAVLVYLAIAFFDKDSDLPLINNAPEENQFVYEPTIEIVDQDASATSGKITNRMHDFIGQAENSFRELGYKPIRAVVPSGAIREVDFYLDGYTGFIKMTIDRGSAESVEDADRLIRYLAGQGTNDFTYLDVRLEKYAYWK